MQLTHKIALCPTPERAVYFTCACGTGRCVWNWALAEWKWQDSWCDRFAYCGRWFVAIQVEVVDAAFYLRCMKRLVLTWALRRRPGFPMASLLNLLCASSSQDSRQTPFLQG
ncbi:helix-turn-helix domain-containing protein [Caldichromatium japonicum]|uniref:helix-turn-helix domain-containing protein n=1 Tax=Caldichromatium japonicum TaxID=2699430 RepID=UPI001B35470B|nr:helix-turn-helix domain-containing protein [Caldichromatium japonicum]